MITCFGEPLLDVFASPVGATFEDAEVFVPKPGGAPLNVAMVLGRAGVPTRFVGAVGADPLGDRIVRGLRSAGVDPSGMARSSRKTGMVFIQVGLDGSRSFLGYAESGAEYDFSPADFDRARPEPLEGASWLVVGSGSLTREPMVSALRHVVGRAQQRGVPIAVDLNVRAPLWSSREAMIEGCRWLAGQAAVLRASEEDLVALGLAPTLASLRELNAQAPVVLTQGARGAAALVGKLELRCESPKVKVVDTTGAGDAFTAGLVAHLFKCGSDPGVERWREALACACRFGAHCCTALGCSEAFAVSPIRCVHEVRP
ncbi:MAG TPA: carbohydrate kinase [Myxococcales bacterium]|jgi:fructokinase